MQFIPVRTRAPLPPRDNLFEVASQYLPQLVDGDILLVTSKVLAIHQGRCVPIDFGIDKTTLAKREADFVFPRRLPFDFLLTIKHATLIPSSGIDESNGNGHYILWPRAVQALLRSLRKQLLREHGIKRLGIIATDSHTTPLRIGVTGIAIGWEGFEPLSDYRGKKDLFGRRIKFTQANSPDSLASMGVFMMGESNEQTPLLIIRGMKKIFTPILDK